MADEPIRSVLYDVQARQGGTFDDFGGWMWTLDFGDVAAEYEALRSGAGMWDVYALNKWLVSGPDAQAALQAGFTNNLSTQEAGQVKYGAFVDDAGLVQDEGTIYKLADGTYYTFTNAETFDEYVRKLVPSADVQIENRLHDMPLISVQGPRSREILQSLGDFDFSTLKYFRFATEPVSIAGIDVFMSRTGFSGELGYELIPARDKAEELWLKLGDAGVVPVGFNAIDIARVEAGLIVFEYEYEPGQRTPFDLGLDRMVSFAPDVTYVGKSALQAIADNPPRRLKTLRLEPGDLPEIGAEVTRDGAVVGTLTSPTSSPRFGNIALAVIDSSAADNDTVVSVGGHTATVADLSIFDPNKVKPRA
ncbi:MAG TPA: aminomethyltransferase family protein [Actinomycetes bacterium]|nr:aminomethyltransferase family protein [Actinomycetes bacterium]